MHTPSVHALFDRDTATFCYVVHRPDSPMCAVIDPVLNYDAQSGRTRTTTADQILTYIKEQHLQVQWILETHAHADHLSAAMHIKEQCGGEIAVGVHITDVQKTFSTIFNLPSDFPVDGSQFDRLIEDQEVFNIGNMTVTALHVPGHTPADMAYCIKDVGIFIGDTLFMPDVGTARCDFPGGSAHTLYQSIQKILSLGDDTVLYFCHDYPPEGRGPRHSCTVRQQREHNIHIRDGIDRDAFIAMRTKRDQTLKLPALILPSLQVNIRAGALPPPEGNGVHYLKIPLNQF